MTTPSVSGTGVSEPQIGASAAESEGLGELPNDLCAAVIAMDLRQPLQVIFTAHDVLARRLRGGAVRAQLTLIEAAAMRLAGTVDRLVEILRHQEGVDRARRTTRNAKDRMMENDLEEIKLYSDYKSPYAYLAFDPGFAMEEKYRVRVRWIPFQLRIKGKGERSVYSEYKVKYSYLDARRWANMRGGLVLRGPLKIYDTRPALIGGLFAQKHGKFMEYSRFVYGAFFKRELEIDQTDAVAKVIADLGMNEAEFREYLSGEGAKEYDACLEESTTDHIFGVPIFVFRKEPFWGNDRIPLLEMRLKETGLAR